MVNDHKFILLISLLFLASCGVPRGGRMLALEDVDARGWSRTMLRVSVDDTLAVRDLAIYIRYDGTYEGGALPLSIHAQAPGGAWADDSLTARFGGAAGAIREARIPYRRGVVFPRKGIYTFNISAPEVRGIRAVGMIENGQGQAEKI